MDAAKSRPTVTITTYSASSSSYLKQSDEDYATKCEFSTNLFRNNIRRRLDSIIGSEEQRSQPTSSGNVTRGGRGALSDLSQIRGPTGSVRGHKDVVRKSLEGIKVTYHNRFMNFHPSSSSALSSSSSSSSSSGGSSMLSFSTFFANQSVKQQQQQQQQQQQNISTGNQTNLTSFSVNKQRLFMTSSSLMTIDNELYCSEYLERLVEDEQNLCVAYTTTLGVIRRTFEDSKMLRSILDLNLVKYEERDIYLNQEYKYQLKMRSGSIVVPAMFVDGVHIGGAKELEIMNENGELQKLLAKFKMSKAPKEICYCCGNAKFIACQSCNGSRKSTIHHFKFNSVALRCIKCDKNDGLVQCPVCCNSVRLCESNNNEQEERVNTEKPIVMSEQQLVQESQNKLKLNPSNSEDKLNENLVDFNNNNVEC